MDNWNWAEMSEEDEAEIVKFEKDLTARLATRNFGENVFYSVVADDEEGWNLFRTKTGEDSYLVTTRMEKEAILLLVGDMCSISARKCVSV